METNKNVRQHLAIKLAIGRILQSHIQKVINTTEIISRLFRIFYVIVEKPETGFKWMCWWWMEGNVDISVLAAGILIFMVIWLRTMYWTWNKKKKCNIFECGATNCERRLLLMSSNFLSLAENVHSHLHNKSHHQNFHFFGQLHGSPNFASRHYFAHTHLAKTF